MLPLIAFDALLEKGINSILYADDGLLYGFINRDYPAVAGEALFKASIGAEFG